MVGDPPPAKEPPMAVDPSPVTEPHDGVAAAAPDRIYDEIPIAQMEWVEDDEMYYYECPCGDMFEISKADIDAGKDIAKCPSCSLKIRVLFEE